MILHHAKSNLRRLLGTAIAGRDLPVRESDRFVVSFPRSGNTWMRFLVTSLLNPTVKPSFAAIEQTVPDIYQNTLRDLRRIAPPRILKSHEAHDPRYGGTLYIVRDPRDVAVSYCRYLQRVRVLPLNTRWEEFVESFVRGKLDSFGRWNDHVESWMNNRTGRSDFLFVRYEEVLANTLGALEKIAAFISVSPTKDELKTVVDHCSLSAMRANEVLHHDSWSSTRNGIREIPFVGPGVSGTWKSVLPPTASDRIEQEFGDLMLRLGYNLSEKPESP